MIHNEKIVLLLLRLSIASVFLYAAVAATLQPQNWIWYIPEVFQKLIPGDILLHGFSLYQLVLGIWILSGKKTFFAGLVSSLTLLGIIAANIFILDVLFRDFAIFFASLALTTGSYKKIKN